MLVALRHRKEDIPVYIDRFLKEIKKADESLIIPQLPQDVLNKLLNYSWPGNLRELRNTLQRLIMLSQGRTLTLSDLPPVFTQEAKPLHAGSPYQSLEEVEKKSYSSSS